MRVALYARVSTEDQVEGFSIDAQLGAMRDFAKDKTWEVVGEYVDAGYSARSDSRPRFKAMIADAKTQKLDIILVHKLDRFSRRREEAVTLKALLKKAGVSVVSVSEPLDPDSPAGVMVEGMLEVINEWYSVNLGREVAKGRRQRAEQGLWNGDLPFGYVKGGDGLAHIVPEEADVMRQAFRMYGSGNHTYQEVASWLNQTKFRPRAKRRDRRQRQYLWSKDTVKDMLRNPFYLGLTKYKGQTMPGRHQPIVDRELYDAVQKVRAEHYHGPSSFTKRYRVYLLAGLIRCAECGEKLWAHHINGHDYYREESSLRGIPCPNPKRYLRAEVVDDQVSEVFGNLTLPPSWRDLVIQLVNSSEEREAARKERARLEEKLRRLARQYREVEIAEEEYRRERDITQTTLAALQEAGEGRVIQVGDYIEGMVAAWGTATKEERRDLLRMALQGVYVDMESAKVVAIKPKPAFLPLFNCGEPVRAGSKVLVSGDPDGIRTHDLQLDKLAC